MKKSILVVSALLGMLLQTAVAAPIGWYSLNNTWRDGSFSGRFYYDTASPSRITGISGTLMDIAQTTSINNVWSGEQEEGASWIFVNNALPGDPDTYDAGFYLNLVDLGTGLALDMSADNGLYDWSRDFAFFVPEQLNASPLIRSDIAQVADVPEPGTLSILSAGLAACLYLRRRKPSAR